MKHTDLVELMRGKGLVRKDICDLCGVSPRTVSYWRSGRVDIKTVYGALIKNKYKV